jgi:hypothetical protein
MASSLSISSEPIAAVIPGFHESRRPIQHLVPSVLQKRPDRSQLSPAFVCVSDEIHRRLPQLHRYHPTYPKSVASELWGSRNHRRAVFSAGWVHPSPPPSHAIFQGRSTCSCLSLAVCFGRRFSCDIWRGLAESCSQKTMAGFLPAESVGTTELDHRPSCHPGTHKRPTYRAAPSACRHTPAGHVEGCGDEATPRQPRGRICYHAMSEQVPHIPVCAVSPPLDRDRAPGRQVYVVVESGSGLEFRRRPAEAINISDMKREQSAGLLHTP